MRKKPNTARSIWRTLHLIIINVRINRLIQRGRRIRRWRIMIRPPPPPPPPPCPPPPPLTPHSFPQREAPSNIFKVFLISHGTVLSLSSSQFLSFLDCCVCPPFQTVSSLLSLILHHLILFFLSFLIQKSQSICTFPFFWQFLHYVFSTTPCDFLCSDSVLFFSRIMNTLIENG